MPRTIFQGKLSHRLRSAWVLTSTLAAVLARRAIGRPLVPEWSIPFETGTLFYRRQFNHAFALGDIAEGRAYFDSCFTTSGEPPAVEVRRSTAGEPPGEWFTPHGYAGPLTMLYFHGGGYSFHAAVTRNFIALLSEMLQVRIFSLDYRLTPEHPHPAQIEDALSAYRFMISQATRPADLILCGDSAGGHLVLMTLAALQDFALPQPLLTMAISPWTYIGRMGESQFGNDRYDMVQGYQTLQYAQWLKGETPWTDEELSPMGKRFLGASPVYIQAGDKEILVDMIREFSHRVAGEGAAIRLDVWPHMTHEFHAYGDTLPESRHAIARMRQAIDWAVGQRAAGADHADDVESPAGACRGPETDAGNNAEATRASRFPPIDETEVDTLPGVA